MRYHITHETHYSYDSVATLSQQLLFMSPRNFESQICLDHQIDVTPVPNESANNLDYFGNISHYFSIFTPHQDLIVRVESTVDLFPRPSLQSLEHSTPWEIVRDRLNLHNGIYNDAVAYLYPSPKILCSDALADYARPSFSNGRGIVEAAFDLTQRIYREFEFDSEATNVSTPLSEVLEGRRGVCQDFAHLMIGCLRSMGLACRYVSGYILTIPLEGHEKLIGADASHAWVSVYCHKFGWIDFDPTNNCLVQNDHITVAWGRDFSDVSPMRGVVLGGGAQTLKVSVTVTPIWSNELSVQLSL